jgi:lipopolysaccharide/colanic/teichoic acid biosynthesis glycosyltransferase
MGRFLDILLSTLALVVLSPLLLVVALVVMVDSKGSAFYLAPRSGKGGKTFRMWKFRTMVTGAAKLGTAITGRDDVRITRVGRLLRASKIDELPQFINVLMGHMSLVGPRPESPGIVALYTTEQRRVLEAKPGVTGRVQLDSREESELIPAGAHADDYYVRFLMDRKIQADLSYLKGRTLLSDAKILMETGGYILHSLVRLTTKKQIVQDVKEVR